MNESELSGVDKLEQELSAVSDPAKLLALIVDAVDSGYFGYDPYYADIKDAYLDGARALLAGKAAP